jgi:hypothetical protein
MWSHVQLEDAPARKHAFLQELFTLPNAISECSYLFV